MKLATDQPRAPSLNPKNVKKRDDGDGDDDDDNDDNDEDIDELLREIGIVKLGGNCFASAPFKSKFLSFFKFRSSLHGAWGLYYKNIYSGRLRHYPQILD
jgi:hypothetical protein